MQARFLLNKNVQRCMFRFRKKKIKMYTSHSLFYLKSGWRQSIKDSISCGFWLNGRRLPQSVMDDGVWQISPTINKTTSFCIEDYYFLFRFFQTFKTRNEITPILLTEKIFIFKIKEENRIIFFNIFYQGIKLISQFYQRNLYMRTLSSLNSSGFLNQHQGALTLYVSILKR